MRFLSRRRVLVSVALALPTALLFVAWRAASWRPITRKLSTGAVLSLEWSPDGKELKGTTGVGTHDMAQSFSLDGATLEAPKSSPLKISPDASQWVLSPDGKIAAFSGGATDDAQHTGLYSPDYWVALADSRTGKISSRISACRVGSLAFSSDGSRLLVGASSCGETPAGETGSWALLQTKQGQIGHAIIESDESAESALWTHDGTSVWVALRGGVLKNISYSGKANRNINTFGAVASDETDVTALALSADDQTIALATCEPTPKAFAYSVSIIDAKTGHIVHSWHPTTLTTALAWAPNGEALAVADAREVRVHPLQGASDDRALPVKDAQVLAFSPDDSRLAIGTSDGQVQVWRLQ